MNDKELPVGYPGDPRARQLAHAARPASAYVEPVSYGPGIDDSEGEGFNPLQLLLYVVRYRWLIVGILAAGLMLGIIVSLVMTPLYRGRAVLEVAPPSARVFKDLQVVSETADLRTFKTALEKLKSRELMQRVVGELGLSERRDFVAPGGFSLTNLLKRAIGGDVGKPFGEWTGEERERAAIEQLKKNASMTLVRGTSLIAITYSSPDPELARQIANQFATSFIAQKIDKTSETSGLARQFIAEQVAEVKKKLEKAEKKLVQYAKEQGITVTGEEGSLVSANIRDINEALSKAIQERLRNERLVAQIKAGKAAHLEQVLTNEAIQKNRSRIAELKGVYRQKLSTFKPSFPEMRELAGQIKELEKLLKEDIAAIASGIELDYQGSIRKEKDLRTKLAELEAKQAAYQDKNIRYTILKREVDSYRSQYKSLIDKLNDLGVSSEIKNKTASIVEYAATPERPYSPSLPKNLAIALLLSLMATGGSIYMLELLNNTFTDPDQLENELKASVLGILPAVEENELPRLLADPKSSLSEAYRTLRTSIQFTGINGAPRSLVVTSTEPGEGKSSAVRKLAEEFGALGLNVLIIDGDMRKPVQHRLAGIANSMGLSNLLTNTVPVEQADEHIEVMRNTPWPNVWLVTAGTLPPNPANLLASQKMGLFIEACCNRFDIVIIDSPPVIGLADALLLSRMAEATLLMVSAHQVARKAASGAYRKLKNSGGHMIGAALNKFKLDRMEYNYAYRYMSYGYITYGADEESAHKAQDDSDGAAHGKSRSFISLVNRKSLGRLLGAGRGHSGKRG